jgi:cyclase
MYRPRIIPVLLLKDKGLVKTVGFDKYKYIGDPINAVKIFNEKEVDELVFLDIHASKEKRTIDSNIIKEIADEAYMPFAAGGGINNVSSALAIIKAGTEKVVINSAFTKRPQLVTEIANETGNQSVIVSIDAKKNWLGKWQAFAYSGTKKTSKSPLELAMMAEDCGAGEIMLTCISKDGTMEGYDLELIESICQKTSIPVIACGGAGNIQHFQKAMQAGANAAAAGSMFVYHGPHKAVLINYKNFNTDLIYEN